MLACNEFGQEAARLEQIPPEIGGELSPSLPLSPCLGQHCLLFLLLLGANGAAPFVRPPLCSVVGLVTVGVKACNHILSF